MHTCADQSHKQAAACCPAPNKFSCFRAPYHFILLYLVALFELLRQLIATVRLHKPSPNHSNLLFRGEKPLIIISGTTSGIGRHLLHTFQQTGVHIIILLHQPQQGIACSDHVIPIDFSCVTSTHRAANILCEKLQSTRASSTQPVIFFHCAAVYNPPSPSKTDHTVGHQTLVINTFSPLRFIQLTQHVLTCVIYLASSSHRVAPIINPDTCLFHTSTSPFSAYPLSKLLTLIWIQQWAKRTDKVAIAIHPGVVATSLYRGERGPIGFLLRALIPFVAWTPKQSALRVLAVLEKAQIFTRSPTTIAFNQSHNQQNMYWDAVTLNPASLPRQIDTGNATVRIFAQIEEAISKWESASS